MKKKNESNKANKVQGSMYQKNVLMINASLKTQLKSLGGCRSVLLNFASEIELTPIQIKILKSTKDQENYKLLQKQVRTSKSGNYSPFFLLQALYKNESAWKELFKTS
jgi:hypothetical protein